VLWYVHHSPPRFHFSAGVAYWRLRQRESAHLDAAPGMASLRHTVAATLIFRDIGDWRALPDSIQRYMRQNAHSVMPTQLLPQFSSLVLGPPPRSRVSEAPVTESELFRDEDAPDPNGPARDPATEWEWRQILHRYVEHNQPETGEGSAAAWALFDAGMAFLFVRISLLPACRRLIIP
jgi:hypothetical protein